MSITRMHAYQELVITRLYLKYRCIQVQFLKNCCETLWTHKLLICINYSLCIIIIFSFNLWYHFVICVLYLLIAFPFSFFISVQFWRFEKNICWGETEKVYIERVKWTCELNTWNELVIWVRDGVVRLWISEGVIKENEIY